MDLLLAVAIGFLSAILFAVAAHSLSVLSVGARAVGSVIDAGARAIRAAVAAVIPSRRQEGGSSAPAANGMGAARPASERAHLQAGEAFVTAGARRGPAADLRLTMATVPKPGPIDATGHSERRPCPACRLVNLAPARFCRSCGAHLRA